MLDRRPIGRDIHMLGNLIRRQMGSNAAYSDASRMTGMHGWVIGYLCEQGDTPVYQRDLERCFHIRRSSVTGVLQLMERNGLITRVADSDDLRLKRIVLTDKALRLHEEVRDGLDDFESRLREGLDEKELATFFSVVDQLRNNLEHMRGGQS